MPSNMNPNHTLYGNIVRALKGDINSPKMVDQDGSTDTAEQATWNILTTQQASGVSPTQGIATDGQYWYQLDTANLYKKDFVTGSTIASNTSPFTDLPSGVDHIGDGFVFRDKLYVPVVDWDSATQTSANQTIAVYNCSDLSLDTQYDISSESASNCSGLCRSHTGEIYVTSYFTLSTPNSAQTTIYRYSMTGTYLGTLTLSSAAIGAQGIVWDGTYYLITIHDTINSKEDIIVYNSALTYQDEINPTGITPPTDEIEGIESYNRKLYTNSSGSPLREFTLDALYHHLGIGTPVAFLDNADLSDDCSVIIRMTPVSLYNYNTIMDNKSYDNDWEAWIYDTGELSWRVNSAVRNRYSSLSADTQYMLMFSWSKSGSSVTIELGVDGAIEDTDSGTWLTPPTLGMWLGGAHANNTLANILYHDLVVYDKQLSASEFSDLYDNFDAIYHPTIGEVINNMTSRNRLPMLAM